MVDKGALKALQGTKKERDDPAVYESPMVPELPLLNKHRFDREARGTARDAAFLSYRPMQ